MFIDRKFVQEHKLETSPLPHAIPVCNVDGSVNENGSIVKEAHDTESAHLAVANLGWQSVIIGHSWLLHHNPEVDWAAQKVTMSCCPSSCGRQMAPDNSDNLMEPGDTIGVAFLSPEGEEYIQAMTTPSQQLAQEASAQEGDGQELGFKDMVSEHYHDFKDIFSKEAFAHLPPRKAWDHAIDLAPNSQLPQGHTFPLSPTKQRELDEFL